MRERRDRRERRKSQEGWDFRDWRERRDKRDGLNEPEPVPLFERGWREKRERRERRDESESPVTPVSLFSHVSPLLLVPPATHESRPTRYERRMTSDERRTTGGRSSERSKEWRVKRRRTDDFGRASHDPLRWNRGRDAGCDGSRWLVVGRPTAGVRAGTSRAGGDRHIAHCGGRIRGARSVYPSEGRHSG
jgi:hypothetical protein